ncbi:MAG TPA: hypothetical protein VF371_09600, partial [Candidatus Limnocylindrales bacterium]
MKTARPPAGYLATHRLTPTASITGAGTLQEVSLTSVETASLQQRAAPSLTPPTARRHSRLKELSEVSPTSAPSAEITFHPGSMTFQETFVGSSLLASSSAPRER